MQQHLLGETEHIGKYIYKIGLSLSPQTRLANFQKALPQKQKNPEIYWELYRSTTQDGYKPYSSFDIALAGEDEMKNILGTKAENWFGGEFYLATDEEFEHAWKSGRDKALEKEKI